MQTDTKESLAGYSYTRMIDEVESRYNELVATFQHVIRENLFSNMSLIHPRRLNELAVQEMTALLGYLREPSTSAGFEQGNYLCRQGFSSQTVLELCRVHWEFFLPRIGEKTTELEVISHYMETIIRAFYTAREDLILSEQERFRLIFQKELNHTVNEMQEARQAAQRATEMGYRKVLQAQEEERHRIARELHDGISQSLIGIRMDLEEIKNNLTKKAVLNNQKLLKVIESVDNIINENRALAYSLRPPILDLLGIHLTIKQLCLDFSNQSKLEITYSGMDFPLLADELAISLYRIAQEALANIAKHAAAKHAWVTLTYNDDVISMAIKDDGKGFDPSAETTGMGLVGMQERVRLLSGIMNITSSIGEFSLLEVTLPMRLRGA